MVTKGFIKCYNKEVNAPYYELFQEHVSDVRNRQNAIRIGRGIASFKRSGDGDSRGKNNSRVEHWTSQEKDIFFAALASYSRLRPDMIASCIKTKNVLEVVAYLEQLETAAERLREDDEEHGSGGDSEEGEDEGGGSRVMRSSMDGAMEMSDQWIAFEEEQAQGIAQHEAECSSSRRAAAPPPRDQQHNEQPEKQRFARGTSANLSTDTTQSFAAAEKSDGQHDRPSLLTVDRAFTLNELDSMETLFRQVEDSSLVLASVPGDIRARFKAPRRERKDADEEAQPSRSQSNSRTLPTTSVTAEAMNGAPQTPPDPAASTTLGQNTSVPDLRAAQPVNTQKRKRGEQEAGSDHSSDEDEQEEDRVRAATKEGDEDNTGDEDVNGQELSPASLRRIRKRLYMRQRRALKAGKGSSEVDVVTVKLKPGRQTKPRRPAKKRKTRCGNDANSEREEDTNDEGDSEEEGNRHAAQYARGNKGGLRALDKARKRLLEEGLDAQRLQDEGLRLFNWGMLAKLLKIFASGYVGRNEGVLDPAEASITASTIRLLSALTVQFVTEVVQRSLAINDMQESYKRNTKVWRRTKESHDVSIENIKLALEMMGCQIKPKEHYVGELLGEPVDLEPPARLTAANLAASMGPDATPTTNGTLPTAESTQANVRPSDISPYPTNHALHRELYEPYIYLPLAYRLLRDPHFGSNRGEDIGDISADLLEDPVFLQQEEEELEEEERIDEDDSEVATQKQMELWDLVYRGLPERPLQCAVDPL